MPFPAVERYLAGLCNSTQASTNVWLDADGCAQGRYFNSTLTSSFQPIRVLGTGRSFEFEGFARSYSASDPGLCVWKLLDHAAGDLESIELDRLCRMLHAINFFRQPEAHEASLFVSVHARLLAAVEGKYGSAFRRILELLELPQERVVVQLPAVTPTQNWVVNAVAENYRRNGFRYAVNANTVREALILLDHVRPDVIKLDVGQVTDYQATLKLLAEASKRKIQLIFKRVGTASKLTALQHLAEESGQPVHVQGYLWDLPQAMLAPVSSLGTLVRSSAGSRMVRDVAQHG